VRPWVDTPNRKSHGQTVRVGRSASVIIPKAKQPNLTHRRFAIKRKQWQISSRNSE